MPIGRASGGRAAWKPPAGGDETLGLVDFSIFPHLDHPELPENTMADAEKWAARVLSGSGCGAS